jgi:hypothetical protein
MTKLLLGPKAAATMAALELLLAPVKATVLLLVMVTVLFAP